MKKTTFLALLSSMILILLSATLSEVMGQASNPAPQTIPYTQNFSGFTGSVTTYPAGLQGWTITGSLGLAFPTAAPAANQALAGGTNASPSAGVYDMVGKIGVFSTGTSMRAVCLSLNTSTAGTNDIQVSYLGGTQRYENTRQNQLGVQYRIGTSGTFTDVTGSVYTSTPLGGAAQTSGTGTLNPATITFTLPAVCKNQPEVQLRWLIRDLAGSGNRPSFSVDDISVTYIAPTPTLTASIASINAFYSQGGQDSYEQAFTLTGANLTANATVTAPTHFRVSLDNVTYSSSVTINQSGGSLVGEPVTVFVRVHNTAPVGVGSIGGAGVNITCTSTGATTQNINIPACTVLPAPSPFTPGNLVMSRIGSGLIALSNSATVYLVDEYTPAGTYVQSVLLPTSSTGGANKRVTSSGSATSEGQMTLSLDGTKLVCVGYDATIGLGAIVSQPVATVNRIVATVNADGTVNTSTRITDGYDANNIRSGITIDGSNFWTTGSSSATDGGVRFSSLGGSTSTQLSTAPANARVINIFDNQLWISAASSPNVGISKVGSGVSNATGQVITLQSPPANAYSFLVFDRDPAINGVDVLYVADQTGGLLKYSFNGTTWTARGAWTGVASGLTGRLVGGNVQMFVTVGNGAGNQIYRVTDATTNTTNLSGTIIASPGATLICTAAANTVFRAVQFAPEALPGTPAVALTRIEPAAGAILQASNENVLYGVQATASTANAILTRLTLTTSGTYAASDFVPNSFRLWYSPDNSFENTDIIIGTAAVPASGGSVVFNIAQKIFNTTSGYFFLTGDVEGSATIGNTINITATPLANFVFANAATKSGSVTAGGVKTIASSILPTTFYSNGGPLNILSNWGDQPDGSVFVSGPISFSTNNYTYIVSNGSNTIDANWAISGTNSKVQVPALATLNLPAAFTFSGTVNVLDNGTLNILGASVPTFGLLEVNSNVVYAGASPIDQTVSGSLSVPYGNLTLTGSGKKIIGGVFNTAPINVKGQFIIDNTTLDRSLTTFQNINFEKDYTINNGATYLPGFTTYVNLEARGTNNQLINGNGFEVRAGRFIINVDNLGNPSDTKPSGSVTLSNLNGGTQLVLNDDIKLNCGNTTPANTATFIDNGQTIKTLADVEMDGDASNYTLTGSLILNGITGTSNIRKNGGTGSTQAIVAALNNLSIETAGATVTQVQPTAGSADVIIKGNFNIAGTSTGKFTPNGNVIKIGGDFTDNRTIDMIAAGTSTFEFNGTLPQTLQTAFASGESFFNFHINNANNVTITTGNFKCTSTGNLNCISGKLITGTNKVILNNTATITETETSNVQGIVETTRSMTTANETFGGIGLEIQSSPSPGSTLVRRITGATVALGCAGTSVTRLFEVTPTTNTGLNATVKYIYLNSELGDLSEPELQLYRFLGAGPWTEITTGTLNPTTNIVAVTGQTSLGKYSATNPQPIGGQITPASSVICSGTTRTLTLGNFAGLLQWQVSTDNTTWTDIVGATTSSYTTPALTSQRFYRCIASSSLCFDVSSTVAVVNISTTPVVTITNVTSTSATVTWSPFGSGQYNISWTGAGTGSQASVTTNNFVITGLTPNTDLNVTVTLASPTCVGTNPGTATTKTLCAKPTITSLVNATDALGNPGFKVNWNAVAGATTYRVYWRNVQLGAGWSFIDTAGTTKTLTSAVASTLFAGNTIAVYVAVNNCPSNATALGDPSSTSYVTLNPVNSCPIPTFTAVSNCPNQISVTGLSGSPTGAYEVRFRRIFPTQTAGVAYSVSSPTINLSIGSSLAGSVWEVYVRSLCTGNVISPNATIQIVEVKPACTAITNPIISAIDCFGGILSWNPSTCVGITGYYINIKKTSATAYSAYPTSGLNNYRVINWLSPNTAYNVFAQSVSCNGYLSPASQVLTFTTGGPGCRGEENLVAEEEVPQSFISEDGVIVNVFPNPAVDQVTVMASGLSEQEGRVELVNLLGQVVTTNIEPIYNGTLQSQIALQSNIASGVYLVRITSGTTSITRQLVIAR
ncbi:MAG: T9SS type A sorting domain-containing protein [Bacteroidetes bacterium]|nr:T9SS type A sorting domain-containing protein [Bacteroidota bacterium]